MTGAHAGGRLVSIGEGLGELSLGEPGATFVTLGSGGDAANLGVMAARLGASVRLGGRVGDDGLGRWLLACWRSNGIDVGSVRIDADAATGLYVNEPTPDGHRFVYWRTGSAGSRLEPGDLAEDLFDDVGLLVLTGVTLAVSDSSARAVAHAVAAARAAGGRVACVLNHRPALGGDVGELAALARASDTLIGSREDAHAVFGTSEPTTLRELLAGGPQELVVTHGAGAAVAFDGDRGWLQSVPQVEARNAGGAGDALAGAYLAARLRGEPVARSLAWGVAAASLSVQREGCASAYPTAAETAALLSELPPVARLSGSDGA
ncbi:MAG TPA: sugar kinase [Conexibacter sp.]